MEDSRAALCALPCATINLAGAFNDELLFDDLSDEEWELIASWEQVFLCYRPPDSTTTLHDGLLPCYHLVSAGLTTTAEQHAALPTVCEYELRGPLVYLCTSITRQLKLNEVVVIQVYKDGARQAVVECDGDLLTPDEIAQCKQEVAAAILLELQTWSSYSGFSRRPRREAVNVIDCRWVLKWRWVQNAKGDWTRIIRARLTVRGIKDR